MKNIVKVSYTNQKRGSRFNGGTIKTRRRRIPIYFSITIINSSGDPLWWFEETQEWETFERAKERGLISGGYSTHCDMNAKSVKAAIRHAKKHTELPVGTKLLLCSNLNIGVEIRIVGKTK